MYESQNKQGKLLHEENENHKKLANMPLDNAFTRKVKKMQLTKEDKTNKQKFVSKQEK